MKQQAKTAQQMVYSFEKPAKQHGSRNERKAYGHDAPSQRLRQAGDDLMVAHGAAPKPPLEI